MNINETIVVILIGAIFLLLGLIGGGFEISAVRVPPVGRATRTGLFVIGAIIFGLGIARWLSQSQPNNNPPTAIAAVTNTVGTSPTALVEVSPTPSPSSTPQPTPAQTPTPTETPNPTATSTPAPSPTTLPTSAPASTPARKATPTPAGSQLAHYAKEIELPHDAKTVSHESAGKGLLMSDFLARAKFDNPYDVSIAKWDYGFFFRFAGDDHYRLVVQSNRYWRLSYSNTSDGASSYTEILSGTIPSLDVSASGSNWLELVAQGSRGFFFVNGHFVSALDLVKKTSAGQIWVVTGNYQDDVDIGKVTRVENFAIWTLARRNEVNTNGKLIHNPANTNVELYDPNVRLRNLIVSGRFKNPYDTSQGAWDYGFLVRSDSKIGYRVVVDSDRHWNIFLTKEDGSIRADAYYSGTVSSLRTSEAAVNDLELLVYNDQAILYVNDQLAASVDLSAFSIEGKVKVATGMFKGNEQADQVTEYESLQMWGLPSDIRPNPTTETVDSLKSFKSVMVVYLDGKTGDKTTRGDISIEAIEDKSDHKARTIIGGSLLGDLMQLSGFSGITQYGIIELNEDVYIFIDGAQRFCVVSNKQNATPIDLDALSAKNLLKNIAPEDRRPLGRFVGVETVNGVPANHYILSSDAIGEDSDNTLTYEEADVWFAVEGNDLVRMVAVATASQNRFFADSYFDGAITYTYDVSNINQAVNVDLPENCEKAIRLPTPTP